MTDAPVFSKDHAKTLIREHGAFSDTVQNYYANFKPGTSDGLAYLALAGVAALATLILVIALLFF